MDMECLLSSLITAATNHRKHVIPDLIRYPIICGFPALAGMTLLRFFAACLINCETGDPAPGFCRHYLRGCGGWISKPAFTRVFIDFYRILPPHSLFILPW
jgi:hypothetical protein